MTLTAKTNLYNNYSVLFTQSGFLDTPLYPGCAEWFKDTASSPHIGPVMYAWNLAATWLCYRFHLRVSMPYPYHSLAIYLGLFLLINYCCQGGGDKLKFWSTDIFEEMYTYTYKCIVYNYLFCNLLNNEAWRKINMIKIIFN